ncbi:MAG TPA: SDR family oxidoreductase [Bradyrhizobium sp.]|uniref:SDR family NAD(P)-dependent oxidoreductase n=1 Tax=Bradyrhizobium sp. TaxID=376 RepID=UPI002C1D0DBE|nr:SDR family oxidoreductase [Bradyrhizobium sp.]HLZ03199.1 SDR family oxidoreductase [Bradyrhizobium sp.]
MSTQHAVVVGGTRGLGRIVVERFLSRGCAVSVISRHKPAEFPESPRLRHFAADLEKPASLDGLWTQISDDLGPISYLVLSQRFRGQGDPWVGEIQVGLTASRDLIEGFAAHFTDSGDRAIGVVSSVYADYVGSSQPVGYHAVKGGLNAMVRHYAATLGRQGIRVNAIMPLTYLKPESRAFYESNAKLMELYHRLVPLGRLGTAEECANAIDFLCSERASFINGQSLFLDGGVSVVWQEEVAKAFSGL